MKVWCFYLLDDKLMEYGAYPNVTKEEVRMNYGTLYSLYAFTPSKEIANYFWKVRNHHLFYKKIIELSREDYEEFCDTYEKRLLELHNFITKGIDENGLISEELVPIICTLSEADSILYYKESHLDKTIVNGMPYILDLKTEHMRCELREILNKWYNFDDVVATIYPLDETGSSYPYEIDELMVYLHLYQRTFSKDMCVPNLEEIFPIFKRRNEQMTYLY